MWQSEILESCTCCTDSWENKINLDQKGNIWYFNRGIIAFFYFQDDP